MKEVLEALKKEIAELKTQVQQGGAIDEKRVAKIFEEQIEKYKAQLTTPTRRGAYDAGGANAIAGMEMGKIVGLSPRYKAAGWTPPSPTSRLFTPEVEEFQKLNDQMVSVAMLMEGSERRELDTPEKVADACKRLKNFGMFQERFTELGKAMDTATAAEGLEFIPTGFSRELIDRVRIAASVGGLFREIQMPQDPFVLPAKAAARKKATILTEAKEDISAKIKAQTPASRKVQLTAVKLGVRVLESVELNEDSLIAMGEFIRDEIVEALVYGLEDAYINGDTTATHMDTDTNAGAADLAAKAWIGLRKHAQATSISEDLATFNNANLLSLRGKLVKYGANPRDLAWIVSTIGLIKMLGLAEVVTLDKLGALATIITGQLASLQGIPVVVSEEMRDDVDANGVNAASGNTKSNLVLANRRAWIRGVRRAPTIKTKEDIETDQLVAVVTWRGDFQRTIETTEKFVGQGINFA